MQQPVNYDSDFCGSLPIHLTNLIQSYGLLLVIEPVNYTIVQASENTTVVFGSRAQDLVGNPIASFISEKSNADFLQRLTDGANTVIPMVWEVGQNNYVVLIHRKEKFLVIELELKAINENSNERFIDVYQEMKYAMSAIEATRTIEETCTLVARELKRISGFDKVMVYQFDEQWNGHVLAEAKESDMESYFGFTFPASDIPKPARDLYLRNSFRLIPDRNYTPVRLHPVINPITNSFIDLSDCNLRSVAAVHVEYLGNMGVTASMSTRILHHDALWGLIACHHKTPKYLSYAMTSMFEMMSSIISVKITSLQNQTLHASQSTLTAGYAELIEAIYKKEKLDSTMLSATGLMNLFECSGMTISRGGKFTSVGEVPAVGDLDELILWLHTRALKKVYTTDRLSQAYEYAKLFEDIASGLMVIPINAAIDEYVLLFRPEKVHVIQWGGNPEERIQFEQDQRTYHPRHSFKVWQQTVRGISLPWRAEQTAAAEALRSFIYEYETTLVR
ncbi:GAF domain-containing protein [Pseudochryseolinea flava]|uniref:Phytochrome n=1 Tax=Pseudochryseolinea flava TaxID=2059302 RepID=A0A364XZ45_9BACT|nr:GAF domain-containing protein [Pseudochryseolinea flava]RAV98711.1 phytochrome [Pseudochryseolinea flava]